MALPEPPKPPRIPTTKEKTKKVEEQIQETRQVIQDEQVRQEILYQQVDMLLKKQKKWGKEIKSLRKLEQPIVILFRNWKDIEIYEGVKGDTFIVPLPPEHTKNVKVGEDLTKKPGKRTVYLSPSDLYTLQYGNDTIKAYAVTESDAVPIGASPKVWSERLEYTIDAILLNFEAYKKKADTKVNQWIVDLVKYGAIALIAYFVLSWLLKPEEAVNTTANMGSAVGAAVQGMKNTTGITVIG